MACTLLWSSSLRFHDSQAYRKMDVTIRIRRVLERREILLSFQTGRVFILTLTLIGWCFAQRSSPGLIPARLGFRAEFVFRQIWRLVRVLDSISNPSRMRTESISDPCASGTHVEDCSVQFSSLRFRLSGGHEKRFSRDPLPVFFCRRPL